MKRRAFLIGGGTVAIAGCSGVVEGPDAEAAADGIRTRINDAREAAGVPALTSSETLREAARDHSRDMAERDFYAHENPDGQGPADRVACQAGENIHRGEIGAIENSNGEETWYTNEPDELAGYVAEGWLNSESHYENLMLPRWSAIGVGVHVADAEFFATAMFC